MAPFESKDTKMLSLTTEQNGKALTLSSVPNRKADLLYKVLIVGESRIGKTSIIKRLKNNDFRESTISTVGLDFVNVDFEIETLLIRLQIWDTAGQERYRSITRNHFRHTKGVILAYDITDRESFEHLKYWIDNLSTLGLDNEICYLIGNKLDLDGEREVGHQDGLKLANQNAIKFYETSAKTGENLIDIFHELAVDILEDKDMDKIAKYRSANGAEKRFTHNYTMEPVLFVDGEEEELKERRHFKNIFRKKKKQAPKVQFVNNTANATGGGGGDTATTVNNNNNNNGATKRRSIIKLIQKKKSNNDDENEHGCCTVS